MAEKKIRTIKERPVIHKIEPSNRIKRVAVYARVSTQHDNQQSSFIAQQDYYSKMVRNRLDWELVNIYSDSGISGTSIKRRLGFESMMNDARNGEMDLIITKSVSRFARNTVDSLNAIRELKELGIEVYFEKESVWTFDSKGEMLITLLSCLAQEESRNLSENVAWGHRKKYADGRFSLAYGHFLGYDKGQDHALEINEEQAETVREIYRLFLLGKSYHGIADILTKRKRPTPGGKTIWRQQVVKSILTNEKYKGDALLQKSYIVDFLTKKSKKNEGELPQYYVKESHEAIIEPELFDYVQEEVKRRDSSGNRYSGITALSSRVICGECGRAYGPRPWHSTTYNRRVWQCHNRINGHKCKNINIYEDLLQEIVSAGIKLMMEENLDVVDACKNLLEQNVGKQKASHLDGWMTFNDNDTNDLANMICSITIQADRTVEVENICGDKKLLRLSEGNVTGKKRTLLDMEDK